MVITPACRAASPISTLYVVFVKKKRLKARDIIAWEKPLPGERLKRPGNRVQTAQIRVSFGRPDENYPGRDEIPLIRNCRGEARIGSGRTQTEGRRIRRAMT